MSSVDFVDFKLKLKIIGRMYYNRTVELIKMSIKVIMHIATD